MNDKDYQELFVIMMIVLILGSIFLAVFVNAQELSLSPTVEDSKVSIYDAKKITYPLMVSPTALTEENTKLELTHYVGKANVKLKIKKEILKSRIKDSYDCNCNTITAPNGTKITTCDTCYNYENYYVTEFADLNPKTDVIDKDTEIYEVFEGCKQFGKTEAGWGCSSWSDLTIAGDLVKGATWWNISLPYRYPLGNTTQITNGVQMSANGTSGINGAIYWFSPNGSQVYVYCENSGCATGDIALGYEDASIPYEIEGVSPNTAVWVNGVNAWHMNESSATIPDANGTHTLVKSGNPTTDSNGAFGNAVDFDGDTDYYQASNYGSITGTADHTLLCWAKYRANVIDYERVINFGANSNYECSMISRYGSGNTWGFGTWGDNYDSGSTITGNWEFLAQVHYSNGTNYGYVNGSNVASDVRGFNIANNPIAIGDRMNGGALNEFNGSIDECRIYNWTLDEEDMNWIWLNGIDEAFMMGAEETNLGGPPNITVTAPTNTTYWVDDITINFRVTDDDSPVFNVWWYWDAVLISNNTNYVNNSLTATSRNNQKAGVHNFTIYASDSDGTSGETVLLTIDDYEVLSVAYDNPEYETSDSMIQEIIRYNPDIVSAIGSRLYYDGANEGTASNSSNATHYNTTLEISLPLTETNNTNHSIVFENVIYYSNGSTLTANTSTYNQSLIHAYLINSVTTDDTEYLEGANISTTINVSDQVQVATLTAFIDFNSENETFTSYTGTNPRIYTGNVSGPQQDTNPSTNYTITPYLNVSYGGQTYTRTASTTNVTVFRITLTNCSSGVETLLFRIFETVNETVMNGSLEIAFDIIGNDIERNYSFDYSSNHSHRICISPDWIEFEANATLQYYDPSYPDRFYFLTQATLNNVSQTINLYLLHEDIGDLITITVKDSIGNLLDDIIVQFQRYYVGQDKYETVAMTRSDYVGTGSVFLTLNTVWYRIVLVEYGQVLRIISSSQLTDTEKVITTSPTEIETQIDYATGITYSCSYQNATQYIVCTFTDPTGLSSVVCLDVYEVGIVSMEDFGSTCTTSSSATLMVNVTELDNENATAKYLLVASTGSDEYILTSGFVSFVAGSVYGLTGILLSVIIFGVVSTVGISKPELGVISGLLGIIVPFAFGFIDISVGAIGGLVVVGVITFYKVKS